MTNKKFTLDDLRIFQSDFEKTHLENIQTSKENFIFHLKKNVKKWDETVFYKTMKFTKFFISEKNKILNETKDWYNHIYNYFFKEFIEFYEFFYENGSSITNISDYFEDFKSFVSGKHLEEIEKFENESQIIQTKQSNWYKGIFDAFNQEPNDEKFWNDDEYYAGYQKGTDIFRGLIKEAKLLFPLKEPKNLFVEEQKKLIKIINNFEKKQNISPVDDLIQKINQQK